MNINLWDRQERDFSGFNIPKLNWTSPWLYIYGATGAGKTVQARYYVQQWERWEFCYCVPFVDLLRQCVHDGKSYIPHLERLYTHPRMAIDDLGNESEHPYTLHYKGSTKRGTPTELFEDVLHRRHEAKLWTCITSNLSPFPSKDKPDEPSSFEIRYGEKTRSRLLELATIYVFKGDRRLGETPSLELKWKSKATTDVPFLPERTDYEDAKPLTAKELQATVRSLSADNPFRGKLAELILKMKGGAK